MGVTTQNSPKNPFRRIVSKGLSPGAKSAYFKVGFRREWGHNEKVHRAPNLPEMVLCFPGRRAMATRLDRRGRRHRRQHLSRIHRSGPVGYRCYLGDRSLFGSAAPSATKESIDREAGRESRMAAILVVDDQPDLLGLTAMILKQSGHAVLCASSGVEALMVFSSYRAKIDLVLTDVVMPGMSGVELAARLRALDPLVKILLMSGFVPDDARLPKDLLLLRKPFLPDGLIEAVEQILA